MTDKDISDMAKRLKDIIGEFEAYYGVRFDDDIKMETVWNEYGDIVRRTITLKIK